MKALKIAFALALASLVAAPATSQFVLNFRDADMRAFIEDAARVTGRTFIIDSAVQGKVSVVTQRPLSRSEYFEVFLSTLRANGLVAVPAPGGALRIQPVATAASAGGRVGSGSASANNFVTEIFRLRSIDANTAREAVRPLVSPTGSVTASRNSLIVADFADNVRRVRQVLAGIDRDSSATQVVALDNAGAREIADALGVLIGAGGGQGQGQAGGGPAAAIVPIDSSNSVVLRGDPATVNRLAEVARDLDRRAARGTEIRVVFLEHADAEQLLPVLQELLGQPATRSASGGRFSSRPATSMRSGNTTAAVAETAAPPAAVTTSGAGPGTGALNNRNAIVTRFEGANAIVISAPNDVQRMLGEVIRQLDQRRQQVLVEALIVEISDNAARQLGVQMLLADTEGKGPFAVTNYSNVSPNILTIGGAIAAEDLRTSTTTVDGETVTTVETSAIADTLQEAAATQLLNATGGLFGFGIRSGSTLFGAIVKAVQSDNKSNILSTPSILTLDNQEARILVGQEIPITTGEALSDNFDNAFRTVQRENVGISLEVKPQINAGGSIQLDLRQEVSSIAGPVSDDSADLILNKREIETTITVDDGDIVGIGGLLDDNERRTIEKIPLLGDIPILGELFTARSRSRAKTNLMVFIRPTILRTAEDARALTQQRYGYMRQQQYLQYPDREPSLDELVREYMNTLPPAPMQTPPPAPIDPRIYAPPGTPHNPAPLPDPMAVAPQ